MSFGVYDSDTSALLSAVLDAAWRDLKAEEPKYSAAKQAKLLAALTKSLIAAADSGLRDPGELKLMALS